MKTRICVPVAAETAQEMIASIEKAESLGVDLIEVRLDYLKVVGEVRRIAQSTPLPLIATNRKTDQGGRRPQDEESRIRSLLEAAENGFEFVDLELTTPNLQSVVEKVRSSGSEALISHHIFDRTPNQGELEEIVGVMASRGANICKVVTMATRVEDNLICLGLLKNLSRKFRIVCFAMGEKGLLSRILSPLVGGYFTYASIGEGFETAPGQISVQKLRMFYEVLGV
ncbi:MAG: type I 3-dehydroquinate dehydratase [Candidatus Bathyarchaeia archaeon]